MNKVLDLITNQCESCRLREKCIEDECVLYQIEQTILIENEQLKTDLTKEELAYSNLRDTYNKKYNECKLYKEVIEEVREYINNLGTQDGMLKDYKIDRFIKEDLLQILDKVKGE